MSIRKLFFLCALLICTGCSSDVFLDHNGSMPADEKIALVHNGQTKEEVHQILGAPSLTTGLSDDHWIYMSSTIKRVAFMRPTEIDRQILAITFDNNQVSKIDTRTMADGNNIAIDTDETSAADRKQGFFQKYFGGVGTYMPFGNGKANKGL